MTEPKFTTALIVGAGSGLSASLARALSKHGLRIACDASRRSDVEKLFANLGATTGAPDVVIYNASYRTRGPLIELDPAEVEKAIAVTAYGAFLVAQQAVRRMLPNKHGAVLFTGASAGVKGYAQSAPFAMGKFALRGLAQSMARELAPKGIHVAHFVIDGAIRPRGRADDADAMLDPDAIADTYVHVLLQPRSAWTWEVELRPWVERF
jgi:NAD(P)-dependent dehydrogenase (short-subunit alcohol dehydrogenase family)